MSEVMLWCWKGRSSPPNEKSLVEKLVGSIHKHDMNKTIGLLINRFVQPHPCKLSSENKTTRLSVTQSSWAFEVPRRNTMHTAAGLLLYTATEVDLLLHSLRGLGKQWHWTVWRGVTLHLICFQLWGGGPCLLREISWGKKTERHANLKIIEMKSTTYDMVIVWSWWYDTR